MHCYFCFMLWLPHRRSLVIWFKIIRSLWYINVYGANMARLLFDATELESFWIQPSKVIGTCVQKPCLFECPFSTTYFSKSGFCFLLHLKNKYQNHLNPSNDLRMALTNCVPRLEWIISEKATKKSMGLFLLSSKVWNLNSTTEFFLLLSAVLCIMRVVGRYCKSRLFLWFLHFFKTRGCKCRFIFMKGVPGSKKVGNLWLIPYLLDF